MGGGTLSVYEGDGGRQCRGVPLSIDTDGAVGGEVSLTASGSSAPRFLPDLMQRKRTGLSREDQVEAHMEFREGGLGTCAVFEQGCDHLPFCGGQAT